ncbi:MAG: hypothetical protein ACW986_01855 [Promethearchaeota archaeon]|jgi:hypothetical protein
MTEEHGSNPEKGLHEGTKAPLLDTNDVFENKINSEDLYREYRGIVLDFSRGAW